MMLKEEALKLHIEKRGKIEVTSKVSVANDHDLSLAYTPGVAEPCRQIEKNPDLVDEYTSRWNLVAVVSDGSAVLGLGNIGAKAALPVMEGKAVLFKAFGGVDAFPICLSTQNAAEIVEIVAALEPTFGGINLEDIAAPKCFEIESDLKKRTSIPIFHDDQHGTAVVVTAGIINALKITGREMNDLRIVVSGAGAAGIAVSKLLLKMGAGDLILCDTKGVVHKDRSDLNFFKQEIANTSNRSNRKGDLAKVMVGSNCFIGVSVGGIVTREMVVSMEKNPIIFAMANPDPEILPEDARAAGAKVVGTGRSDFPNQINNVLGFPGIFRGALDVRATDINEEMKLAAAHALAGIVNKEEMNSGIVIPKAFDKRVAPAVASAVAKAAMESGVARKIVAPDEVARNAEIMIAKSS